TREQFLFRARGIDTHGHPGRKSEPPFDREPRREILVPLRLDGLKPSSLSSDPILLAYYSFLALPPRTCELHLARMFSFAEFLNHLLVEGGNVVGFATSHLPIVHHFFPVHPICARIFHITLDSSPA